MREGWRGGLVAGRAAELVAVATCGTVEDPERPVEAVPPRFAATVTLPAVTSEPGLARLVGLLHGLEPAIHDYGLTFVASYDPLTTRLRTLSSAALTAFLAAPATGPGRWVFVAPDHHGWMVIRPSAMDTAFVGCAVSTARAVAAAEPTAVVSAPSRRLRPVGAASPGPRGAVRDRAVG